MRINTGLKQKINSTKGASIIMALFLFLICATVGAIVITAASVAAGRRAGIEEADQRYYSVSSAARLFKDLIDGQTVEVERTKTEKQYITYKLVQDRHGISERQGEPSTAAAVEYKNSLNDYYNGTGTPAVTPEDKSILMEAAAGLFAGYDNEDNNYGFESEIEGSDDAVYELKITHPDIADEKEADALGVDVEFTVKDSGNLEVVVSKKKPNGDTYSIKEEFMLVLKEDTTTETDESTPEITKTGEKKETIEGREEITETYYDEKYVITTTTTKTALLTWEYYGSEVQ